MLMLFKFVMTVLLSALFGWNVSLGNYGVAAFMFYFLVSGAIDRADS